MPNLYLEELFPKVFFQGQFAVSFKLRDYLGKDGLEFEATGAV